MRAILGRTALFPSPSCYFPSAYATTRVTSQFLKLNGSWFPRPPGYPNVSSDVLTHTNVKLDPRSWLHKCKRSEKWTWKLVAAGIQAEKWFLCRRLACYSLGASWLRSAGWKRLFLPVALNLCSQFLSPTGPCTYRSEGCFCFFQNLKRRCFWLCCPTQEALCRGRNLLCSE